MPLDQTIVEKLVAEAKGRIVALANPFTNAPNFIKCYTQGEVSDPTDVAYVVIILGDQQGRDTETTIKHYKTLPVKFEVNYRSSVNNETNPLPVRTQMALWGVIHAALYSDRQFGDLCSEFRYTGGGTALSIGADDGKNVRWQFTPEYEWLYQTTPGDLYTQG